MTLTRNTFELDDSVAPFIPFLPAPLVGLFYSVKEILSQNNKYPERPNNVYTTIFLIDDVELHHVRTAFNILAALGNIGGV